MPDRLRGLIAACAVALLAAACGSGGSAPSTSSASLALHGSVPSGLVARPQFTLQDTSGRPYDFRVRTKGRVTLLYAGYTHCPDECPTTMSTIGVALRSLPSSIAGQVTVVFVTVDPRRDTARRLRTWLATFRPPTPYVGLTGTPTQVDGAQVAMAMPVATRQTAPASYGSGAYAMNHFDGLLAYGRDDRLATIYPSTVTPIDLAADLKALVTR